MGLTQRFSRRGLTLVAVISMLSLSGGLVACGDSGNDESSSTATSAKKLYLNAYAKELPYFQDWQAGAAAEAKKLGWSVSGEFANTTPEQQVQQVENALTKQPDAIIVTPIDEKSLVPVLQKAKDQGVQVITLGATVADPAVITSFVGRDNYALGKQKAEYAVEQLGGKGKVAIVHGIRGLTFTEEQAKGYKDVLSKESGIELVDGPYVGGFSSDLGLSATANILTANPGVNAIIYDNDDLALGGAEAIKNAGISPSKIVVIGTDGGEVALDAVEAGTLDYTASLCGFREGASAVDALNTYYGKGSVSPRIVSKTEVFTTENANAKRAELSQRLDCN
jgi:ABC-type sugar transport system substrate-binding protein